MDKNIRLADELEILLITYNRSSFLDKTLQIFKSSLFRECCITVLDNCSPDDTYNTVMRHTKDFKELKYVCNRLNIGGNPNYLKAIEMSTSRYTWIVCDDDNLDFSSCDDVLEAVTSGEFDLIEVGATERGDWPRGRAMRVHEMVSGGYDYYFRMSFFPAYIFRTSLFDETCFAWGYKHIDILYPQFEFLNKSVRENFNLYLAKNRIVVRNEVNDHSFAPLFWYNAWVTCCMTITNSEIRNKAIDDATSDRGFFKCLGFWTILDRYQNPDGLVWRILNIIRGLSWPQKIKYLLVLPLVIMPVPLSLWVWVRKKIYYLKNVPDSEIPSLTILDRG